MRAVDWWTAVAVHKCWEGKSMSGVDLCPLLVDLDRLLAYLDESGIKPGHAVNPCPACGQEHRWALLNELMVRALWIEPRKQSALLEMVDRKLDSVRELYGGEEGWREVTKGAERFFAGLEAKRLKDRQ